MRRTLEILKRFKPGRAQLIGGSLILSAGMLALAAVPNTFTSGTTISSTAVNANFTDADTRITTLEGVNAATRLGTLEATITGGNLVLAPSTATTGNIMKGTNRFLHNFGTDNTFIGVGAGNFTMTGTSNTASGFAALASNTTGYQNTASGAYALVSNTTGTQNTASGLGALNRNTTGTHNTASGYGALYLNTTGVSNTAYGVNALMNSTTGISNIAIGYAAGFNWTGADSSNIAIGSTGIAGDLNTTRIGGGGHNRAFIAGIRGVTTGAADAIPVVIDSNGQLGTISSSQRVKDHIADMGEASSTLTKLRPVTFFYKSDKNPKGRSLQYGLIAEEVEKVAPNLVARSANGEIETVFYQHLTPMLLNEYQKQQRLIETQTALLAKQTARVAALEKQGQEIVALKQELALMAGVLARLRQTEKFAGVR